MIVYRELSSVEKDLGFSAGALYSVSNRLHQHYQKRQIPKGNGEYRTLYVPDGFLKAIQRAIADRLLAYERISPFASAYRSGGSTLVNARSHINRSIVLKLDIRHFYDYISYPMVKEKVFCAEKYSEAIRILLSLLCIYKDVLPQGAPTSPVISNIVMREFDDTVGRWCMERNIHYSRYCDDMTFSGELVPRDVIAFVKGELRKIGFFLNSDKTVVLRNGQRKTVTGIIVNEKLNTPSDYRRRLRQELYYCRTYGVKAHIEHENIKVSAEQYLTKLLGQVNYVLSVSPQNTQFLNEKKWLIEQILSAKNHF